MIRSPTTTSYGRSPPTRIVVVVIAACLPLASFAGQPAGDLRGDLGGLAAVGSHGERGKPLIDGDAPVEQDLQRRPRVADQQRTRLAEADPLSRHGEPGFQVNDGATGQLCLRPGVEHRSAADRDDARGLLECPADGGALEFPERRFAVLDENVADRLSCRGLNLGVGVGEADAKLRRQQRTDRGLTRARRADQDGGHGLVGLRADHRITSDSRYPRRFLRTSDTLSPPNFSTAASAITSAAIASATTPAAGTAVTSLRWLMARAGSPVRTSTVPSARGTVEIGFIAARTRIGPPVLIPPSIPPARLVTRRTPSAPGSISSCASEPGRAAVANPSPISTPLIAGMLIIAPASRPSSRRSHCT